MLGTGTGSWSTRRDLFGVPPAVGLSWLPGMSALSAHRRILTRVLLPGGRRGAHRRPRHARPTATPPGAGRDPASAA